MALRWEDERYVRLYTRDTNDWLDWSFEAQGLFALILRKVDRTGVLELGRKGKRGVAVAIGHRDRWDVVEPALEELLDDGCVEIRGDALIVRNYIEAQEAKQSDAARQRAHRERARDLARHGLSRNVTGRDTTPGGLSQPVTPSLAVPSRAVPIGELPAADPPPAVPENQGANKNTSGGGARRGAPAQVSFADLEERRQGAVGRPGKAAKALSATPLPAWLEPALWESWRADRKARRKPLTQRAEELQLRELGRLREEGQDPRAVIEQSIRCGWQGLFPVKSDARQLPPRAEEDDRPRPPPIEELRARRAAQTHPAEPESLGAVLERTLKP